GGSVADDFASSSSDGRRPWLENELNARFVSPNGKPFRILNGALSGWKLPNQLFVMQLYGSGADAFISLDGYNEALFHRFGGMLDSPAGPMTYRFYWPRGHLLAFLEL